MTLITQETPTYFTLTTEQGKEIGVSLGLGVSVYIRRNGLRGLPQGKHFATFAEAIAAYKSEEIKAALGALDQRLGVPSYTWA